MKKYYILFILLFTSFSIFAQTLQPTENQALVLMLIVNNDEQPISTEVAIISKTTKQVYETKSNAKGIAELLIPINDTYSINLEGEPDYDEIVIPNEANYGLQYQIFYDKNRKTDFNIATINYILKTSDGKPLSETVTLINLETTEETTFKTDKNGNAVVKLQNNSNYSINYKSVKNYDVLTIPNVENLTMNFNASYEGSSSDIIYPNRTQALFVLTYYDLDSVPVPNETFTIKSTSDGKKYQGKTNEKGEAKVLVPIGNTYQVSATYFENFNTTIIDTTDERRIINGSLFYISSKEYERREKKLKRMLAEREAAWLEMKRLYEEFERSWENADLNREEVIYDGYERILSYTPFRDTIVPVVMRRNSQWTNKLFVVDITTSMTPYADQVKLWYRRNQQFQDATQFVFFNDGGNMQNRDKRIGSTGGIYGCPFCNYTDFRDTLAFARSQGDGGDMQENDLEGILKAITNSQRFTDIVVIVDSQSKVRDISLLSGLNQPVHIILCGKNPINEQYLTIAYQTGGTIHTMREDINVRNQVNGVRLNVGTDLFILTKGRFVRYEEK
ncbi:MAG: hypothetical protein AB8G11_11685 [Saprospiraceae bacterium]